MAEGEFALVSEHMETAREKPGQPVTRGTMAHDHETYVMLVESAVQRRDGEAILKYAPLLEELAERDNHRLYLGIAHRALGVAHRLAGEYSEAEKRLDLALELFDQLGTTWQRGRTLVEMAELEVSRSDQTLAQQYLSKALEAFEVMKAAPEANKAKSAMTILTETKSG